MSLKTCRPLVSHLLRVTGLSQVQENQEKRAKRINNTLSEFRTQLTSQLAKNASRVPGFARKQAGVPRGSDGLASIVVVSILIVLITLISLGFARLMSRATHNALNNQLSTAANYAAQSGINDAISYLKANPDANATKCSDLSGQQAFANSNLSGDGVTQYSCVLINEGPTTLQYQNLPPDQSQIVKATTSSSPDQFLFSWQGSDRTKTSQPAGVGTNLQDITTWNTNNYTPILRVSLYPIPADGSLAGVEAASKTFFFYPTSAGGNVTKIPYTTADGSLVSANCGTKNLNGFNGTADYDCNVVINALSSAGASYYYLRLTPIYGQSDVEVQANDTGNKVTIFSNAQAIIDVTGKSGNAVKRLEARVDISGTGSTSTGNINPTDTAAPEYALRQAMAICKRLNVSGSNVTIDSSYCGLNIQNPPSQVPTVTTTSPVPFSGPSNGASPFTKFGGSINPNGLATHAYYRWAGNPQNTAPPWGSSPFSNAPTAGSQPNTSAGCTLYTATFSAGSGSTVVNDSRVAVYKGDGATHVYHFNCGTDTYYYQLCASNSAGTACGDEVRFTLGSNPSSSSSSSSSSSGSSSGGSSSGGSSSGGTSCSVPSVSGSGYVVSVSGSCPYNFASVSVKYCPSGGGGPQTANASQGWSTSGSFDFFGNFGWAHPYTASATGSDASDASGSNAKSNNTNWSPPGDSGCTNPSGSSSNGNPSSSSGSSSSSSSSSSSGGSQTCKNGAINPPLCNNFAN